jgi:hypothetical protein
MKRPIVLLGLLVLLLIGAMAANGLLVSVPDIPATSAPGAFDARRAMARLARILGDQRPHPVDSAAQDAVRGRLVAELRAMGLQPVVDDAMACNGSARERTIACARVRNVLVTLGPAAGKHLLFVSHYDSTPVGPGASDDGIGIASMLEVAALLKDAPLRRPVSFLFDEGEETGLLGARAFLDRSPLAAKVDTVVNLESRGVDGPAIMFETSVPNGSAVAAFSRALDHPVANSLTTGFYHLIPNSTDVSVFDERDWTILNFAVIGNETRYHSPGDLLDALDPRSLGHMGRQALALGRLLGTQPDATAPADRRLYADVLQRTLVTLPVWAGVAVLWGALLGFAIAAWRRRQGLGRSAATIGAALAGSALATFLLQALVGIARPGEFWRAHPAVIALALDATAVAVSAILVARFAAKAPADRLRLAFWLIFLALGAALSLVVPGALIFFLVPPLIAGAGMLAKRGERLWGLAAWAVLLLTWGPLLHLSQVLLDFDAAWTFAPVAALLALPPLIEMKGLIDAAPRRLLAVGLAALAAAAWIGAALTPAYSVERPQRLTLEYAWDADAAKGQWLVYHEHGPLPGSIAALGPFTHGVELLWSPYKRWAAAAEAEAIQPPAVEKLAEARVGGGRLLTLRLHSRGAEVVRLRFPASAALRAVWAGGALRHFPAGKPEQEYILRCHGRSCDGLALRLLAGAAPIDAIVIGTRSGLPARGARALEGRPATSIPQYSADATYAYAKLRL